MYPTTISLVVNLEFRGEGGLALPKTSHERKLDSVESILKRIQPLIEQEVKSHDVLRPVLEDAIERTKSWIQEVSELKSEHASILKTLTEDSEEATLKRIEHEDRIRRAADRPRQLNVLLTITNCYRSQVGIEFIDRELDYATRLIKLLLKRVGLDLHPVVVFTDAFFLYDAGDICIFTIPYSFYNSYIRWVNLAHEVGHLYTRRICKMDLDKLIPDLTSHVMNNVTKLKQNVNAIDILKRLVIWLSNWIDEIVSDCIAVFLFGIGYLNETVMQSFRDMFLGGSLTHPPTSLRLACQIEIIERMGIKSTNLQQFRENMPTMKEDPVSDALTDLNLSTFIVDWILSHNCISQLKLTWKKIIQAISNFKNGKMPAVDLDIGFGALAYLSDFMSTETIFEHLLNQSTKTGSG